MKAACLLALLMLVAGCKAGGWQIPSERFIYDLACEKLHEEKAVPAGARPAPIEEAKIGLGKSAASVDLPYAYTDAAGRPVRGSQTFWIKRVARTWTVDRSHPTAVYTNSTPVEAAAPRSAAGGR